MASDLNSYLAERYLVADTKPTKKRKRKHESSAPQGLIIADDDETGWGPSSKSKKQTGGDDELGNGPVVAGTSAEFRRAKTSGWKTVSTVTSITSSSTAPAAAPASSAAKAESDEADAILAKSAAEAAAAGADDDDPATEVLMMSDGTHAGLQSAKDLAAQRRRREREEREAWEREQEEERRARAENSDEQHEGDGTTYRDATGRRIDVSDRRAVAAARAKGGRGGGPALPDLEDPEAKERARREMLRGEVQAAESARRREELARARVMTVARGKDDEELNAELKAVQRWNDPMAQFADTTASSSGKKAGGVKGRPVYKGPAPPNRYGIRPGYRWDGVDRSTGFEAEWFKARNRMERNRGLAYAWQMDD